MIAKLLPVILLIIGVGAGIGAGIMLAPAPAPEVAKSSGDDMGDDIDHSEDEEAAHDDDVDMDALGPTRTGNTSKSLTSSLFRWSNETACRRLW